MFFYKASSQSPFFRRKRALFWGIFLAVFFLPLTGWVLNRLLHPMPFPDHDEEEQQAWLKREKWLNEGRKSPDNLPAAAHWLKALQQAKNLPVVRSGFAPRVSGAKPPYAKASGDRRMNTDARGWIRRKTRRSQLSHR